MRCSPEVRRRGPGRAGRPCRGARRCARRPGSSASSSIEVPRVACSCSSERTASAISRRPPYPIATLTSRPGLPAVAAAASFSTRAGAAGQQIQRAHGVHVPAVGDQPADGALDNPQQRLELGGRARQVVRRQQPQGDHFNASFPAPLEQLEDLVRALLVPAGHVEQSGGPGPPAVAVAHHADVPGNRLRRQGTFEPARVEPVNQATKSHLRPSCHPAHL